MAATIKDQEERSRRIYLVYKYYVETGLSYRKLSKYIEEMEKIKISSVTIGSYLEEIKQFLNKKELKELNEISVQHKTQKVEDKKVKERVLEASKLCLKGNTVEEISERLNEGYWTIYRDLTVRLKSVDEEKYKCVLQMLKENSMNNLKK